MTESHPPVGFSISHGQIAAEIENEGDPNWFGEEVLVTENSDGEYYGDYGDDNGPLCIPFTQAHSEEIISQAQPKQEYKIVKDWLFGSVLGEGSFAKVKEVLNVITLERAAVKIIKKRRLRRIPNGEKGVKSELQLLRRLKHKNIIHLIDFHYNPDKEKIYIFMEHCVITLQDLLDSAAGKRLPVHQSHRYFCQLIDGLEYLHDSRVIHKDIKPGNLLLTRDQILKISDFGVAEELNRYTNDDTCYQSMGTPRFQPPEIASGLASFCGTASDIWAGGVTLFNCITGDYPFNGDSIYKLYEKIEKCDLTMPSSLPELTSDLETLLRGMLKKNFTERFTVNDIRNSVWMKRRHPKIISDHFEDVKRIRAEMNSKSTTCFNALCHLHQQPLDQQEEEELPTLDILEAAENMDQLSFADPLAVHNSEPRINLLPKSGQKLPETQSEAGDRRSRLPSLRLTRIKGNSILRSLKKMF